MPRTSTLPVLIAMMSALIGVVACGGGAAPTPTAIPLKPVAATAPAAATKPAATTAATVAPTKPAATTAATVAPTKPAATTAATVAPTKPAATAAPTAAPTKPAATSAPAATGDVAAGQTVFTQNCNGCHPNGNQGVGPALRGRNLAADRIRTQVRNGGGGMPPFSASQISDQQLPNLVAYVQSLK